MTPSVARTIVVGSGAVPSLTYGVLAQQLRWPVAEPGASLDYSLDLTAPLADIADTIVSASVAVSPSGAGEMAVLGLTVTGALLTAILAGGVPGRNYKIKVDVTTGGGDVFEYYVGLLVDQSVATMMPPLAPPNPGFGTAVTWSAAPLLLGLNLGRPISIVSAGVIF